jgi:hypothetical protein
LFGINSYWPHLPVSEPVTKAWGTRCADQRPAFVRIITSAIYCTTNLGKVEFKIPTIWTQKELWEDANKTFNLLNEIIFSLWSVEASIP